MVGLGYILGLLILATIVAAIFRFFARIAAQERRQVYSGGEYHAPRGTPLGPFIRLILVIFGAVALLAYFGHF